MDFWTFLGVLFVLYGFLAIYYYYISLKDFQKRKFDSLAQKKRFKRLLFILPFGQFIYWFKIKKTFLR